MITTRQHIPLIVNRLEAEQPGYWSVYFERPAHFVFEAGDWIDIRFEGRELAGGVTYSISSSPSESDLRITFRAGMSAFKKALQTVQPQERLYISQYGNDYGFQLKQNQSSVLIAGGVGVAPFRSMLKQMYDNQDRNNVMLLYINQNEQFLFQDELELWSKALPGLSVTYISSKDMGRKKREKRLLSYVEGQRQNFYIAGPPAMVESTEHLLIDAGVDIRNIRIDSFGGY